MFFFEINKEKKVIWLKHIWLFTSCMYYSYVTRNPYQWMLYCKTMTLYIVVKLTWWFSSNACIHVHTHICSLYHCLISRNLAVSWWFLSFWENRINPLPSPVYTFYNHVCSTIGKSLKRRFQPFHYILIIILEIRRRYCVHNIELIFMDM